MLATIILFIFLLGLLVLAHEWGHFFAARKLGVRVEEFAFGFPPRIASFTKRGTRYVLNLLPLGGYVKIFGEGGEGQKLPESFASRPASHRFFIIAAGVGMNFVLAWLLFSLSHGLGLPTAVSDDVKQDGARVTIIGIAPGSPAQKAGLKFGDAIKEFKIQNSPASPEASRGRAEFKITAIDEVQEFIEAHRGMEIMVVIERGKEIDEIQVLPRAEPPEGEGPLGIAMAMVRIVRSPWWKAPWDGLLSTGRVTAMIVISLGRLLAELFSTGRVVGEVAGPVGIFVFASQSWELGLVYFLELAAVLSVNLAVLNILPIPALDGGRVAFLFIEKFRGVKMNQRLEQLIHTIGLVILLGLLALVTYRDIVRIF